MTEYRIITNGDKFRVQSRCSFLFIKFWATESKPSDDIFLPYNFDTKTEAEEYIRSKLKYEESERKYYANKKRPWIVVE